MGQRSEELRADIEHRREEMSQTIDAIEDRVSPSRIAQRKVDRAKDWVGGVRERVMGSPDSGLSTTGNGGSGVAQAKQAAQQVGEGIANAPAALGRQTQGNPLVAGAIAFGIGALIASLLPETRPEHQVVQTIQPQLQAATDAAREAGQHTVAATKDAAQGAAADLKDSATEHMDQVKQEATEAAEQVKEQAKGEGGAS